MDDLKASMFIATTGMRAQTTRIRVISENLANSDSTASTPGGAPYRRKVITFRNELDRNLGADVVGIRNISEDSSDFGLEYNPTHPGADENGFVKTSNVNGLVETLDMREASRSYEANLRMVQMSKQMFQQTIDLLQ